MLSDFESENILLCALNGDHAMKGVTAFIKEDERGNFRLVLNDVKASSSTETPDWTHSVIFTENTYNSNKMKSLELTKEQFAEIGENIIIRLMAQSGNLK